MEVNELNSLSWHIISPDNVHNRPMTSLRLFSIFISPKFKAKWVEKYYLSRKSDERLRKAKNNKLY